MAAAATLLVGTTELVLGDGALRLPPPIATTVLGGAVLTIWLERCLALWPRAEWEAVAARVMTLPVTSRDARAFGRLLFASAIDAETSDGRLLVPASHRAAAGIDDRVILVGVGDHAELWAPDAWRSATSVGMEDVASTLSL